MQAKLESRPDLLLLLSLLLAILLTPVLDQGNWSRLVLAAVTFIPVVLSIVRLSQIKRWVWPSVLLALGNVIFVVAGNTFRSQTLNGIRWGFLAAFFALTAAGLFSYLLVVIGLWRQSMFKRLRAIGPELGCSGCYGRRFI